MSVTLGQSGEVYVFDGDFYSWYLNEYLFKTVGIDVSTENNKPWSMPPSIQNGWDGVTFLAYTYTDNVINARISENDREDLRRASSSVTYLGPYISNKHLLFVPGRVAYERITSYTSEKSSVNPVLYKKFTGFQTDITKIDFNWCVESCLPPKDVRTVRTFNGYEKYGWAHNDIENFNEGQSVLRLTWANSLNVMDSLKRNGGAGKEWWNESAWNTGSSNLERALDVSRIWGDLNSYKSSDITRGASMWYANNKVNSLDVGNPELNRLPDFINDHIDSITIQLRRIKKELGDKALLNPYHPDFHELVATIKVSASLIRPNASTLHSFNQRNRELKIHNYLYGYGDCTIRIESDSFSYAVWYLKDDPSKRYELTWRAGVPKYIESLETYYLTVVPEDDPISVYSSGSKIDDNKTDKDASSMPKWVDVFSFTAPGSPTKTFYDERPDVTERWDYFGDLTTLTKKCSGYMGLNHLTFKEPNRNNLYRNIQYGGIYVNNEKLSNGIRNKYYPSGNDNPSRYLGEYNLNYEVKWHSPKNVVETKKHIWWVRNTDKNKFGYDPDPSDDGDLALKTYKYFRSAKAARSLKVKQNAGKPGIGPVLKYGIKITNDDLLSRMKKDLFSSLDRDISSDEFLIYGIRFIYGGRVHYLAHEPESLKFAQIPTDLSNASTYNKQLTNSSKQYFSVVPKYDLIMVKGEHLAWFRVGNTGVLNFEQAIQEVVDSRFAGNIPEDISSQIKFATETYVISPGSDSTKRNVLIKGRFSYNKAFFWTLQDFDTLRIFAQDRGDTAFLENLQVFQEQNIGRIKSKGDLPFSCGFSLINDDKQGAMYRNEVIKTNLNDGDFYQLITANGDARKYPYCLYVDDLTEINTDATRKYIGTIPGSTANLAFSGKSGIYFEYELKDVTFADNWFYKLWVEIVDTKVVNGVAKPRRFFSTSALAVLGVLNSKEGTEQTVGHKHPILIGAPKFRDFPNPLPQTNGFWHQVFDAWILVENEEPGFYVSPYFRRRKGGERGTPTQGAQHSEKYSPLQYYSNIKFVKEKNYLFSVSTTNYFNTIDQNGIGTDAKPFYMGTPWGEWLIITAANIYMTDIITPFSDPLISALKEAKSKINRIDYYHFSNINGFSEQNIQSVSSEIGLVNYQLPKKPLSQLDSRYNPQNPIVFTAKSNFVYGLNSVKVLETDWFIQGYATFGPVNKTDFVYLDVPVVGVSDFAGRGWHLINEGRDLVWFDYIGKNIYELNSNFPVGGNVDDDFTEKTSSVQYLLNNFAARLVDYEKYNLSFDYLNKTDFKISMYIGRELPKSGKDWWTTNIDDLIKNGTVEKLGEFPTNITATQSCEFIGLRGLEYLFFVADPVIRQSNVGSNTLSNNMTAVDEKSFADRFSSTYTLTSDRQATTGLANIILANFRFTTTYSDSNNKLIDVSSTFTPNVTDAIYQVKLGQGNNVFSNAVNQTTTLGTKMGNGTFVSGVWKNGVWNNGWRQDDTLRKFFNITNFYEIKKDTWRIRIDGNLDSVSGINISDRVSISNIAVLNINQERVLLRNYHTVVAVGENYIDVEFVYNISISNIIKDSNEHRILVSKNIWLSGLFLNGYFKGIWNSGIFNGYPLLSKMDESHWIDGIFNGGHFTANKFTTYFSATYRYENFLTGGEFRLAISFNFSHELTAGDVISVKAKDLAGDVYLGTTIVLSVIDDLNIVTGIAWTAEMQKFIVKDGTAGTIYTIISTGLIQNFDFYSNNVSTTTSLESMTSERVFKYNSWIDVNYSNQSAVNIGRPQSLVDEITKRAYSENNLYGYPTNDVITSNSVFRDSFSLTLRRYRLGKRFRRFDDFVGENSSFNDYFQSTDTEKGKDSFNTLGWDFSTLSDRSIELRNVHAEYTTDLIYGGEPYIWIYFPKDYVPNLVVNGQITFSAYSVSFKYYKSAGFFYIQNSSLVYTGPLTYTKTIYEVENVNYGSTLTTRIRLKASTDVGEVWNNVPPLGPSSNAGKGNKIIDKNKAISVTITNDSGLTFSRTLEPIDPLSPTKGSELKIDAFGDGGKLNIIPVDNVVGRTNGLEKLSLRRARYSMVEFDLIDKVNLTPNLINGDGNEFPALHFNTLNFSIRDFVDDVGNTTSRLIASTYLPIFKNVNHLKTVGVKKQEFFYNKRNLLMNITGNSLLGTRETNLFIDNLKFYEVDMIPFFQYFNNPLDSKGNINTAIQIPKSTGTLGTSPVIDASDESFVDDIRTENAVTAAYDDLLAKDVKVEESINWEDDYTTDRPQD